MISGALGDTVPINYVAWVLTVKVTKCHNGGQILQRSNLEFACGAQSNWPKAVLMYFSRLMCLNMFLQ